MFSVNEQLSFVTAFFGTGIMTAGAVNVVRDSRSSVEELLFIYSHSDRPLNQSWSSQSTPEEGNAGCLPAVDNRCLLDSAIIVLR